MESEKKPSILLVDDEKEVTDILFKRLSRRGYPCRTAGNGQEALDSMKESPSEIVVLDVKMPVMDGSPPSATFSGTGPTRRSFFFPGTPTCSWLYRP